MKLKKLIAIGCIVAMTAVSVTGCGGDSSESEVAQESAVSTEVAVEAENGAQIVQVTAIEGDTITAEIGTLTEASGGAANGGPGEAPSGGAPSGEATGDSTEMPEGGAPGEGAPGGMTQGDSTEMPEGGAPNGGDGKAPSGDAPSGEAPSGGAPSGDTSGDSTEMPEGGAPNGGAGEAPGEMPGGGSSFEGSGESITFTVTDDTVITVEFLQGDSEGTIDDVALSSVLEVTVDEDGNATSIIVKNLNAGSGFGGSSEVTNGTAATSLDTDSEIEGETYTSDGDDENALRVDGATVTLTDVTVEKTGGESSNTENGDFYGQNAGLLALNGAEVTITNATVNTDAVNGNGVFSYGEGTVVNIADSTIRTTMNNSGGIQTTGGGTTNATNLDVETQGNSAAAIRSDRGGGTVNVDGGSYVTNGTGSPAIYCTADITVNGATLLANASEGVVVEGKNSVSLTDCDVTGNMSNTYNGDSDENIHCIMIYQSMSGDADLGEAYFSAEGGSITSQSGDMFYITNTDCEINLSNVAFTLANDIFLRVEGNSSSRGWGTEGANGGDVILTTDSQEFTGNILVDEISSLALTMTNGTNYTGAINPDGEGGEVAVTMDGTSTWTLTADTYVTSFDGDTDNIDSNGYHFYVNGEEVL